MGICLRQTKICGEKLSVVKKKIINGLEISKIPSYFVLQSAFYG